MWNCEQEDLDTACLNFKEEFMIDYDEAPPPLFADSLIDCDYETSLSESNNPLESFDIQNEPFTLGRQVDIFEDHFPRDSSSGSEASSTEQLWCTKADITPPTTPPSVHSALGPESICVIASNGIQFLPVTANSAVKTAEDEENSVAVKRKYNLVPASLKAKSKDDTQKQQAERRQQRMIRNRESAYLSRKRAKEHVVQLERQVQDLTTENKKLKKENEELKERLGKYEPFKESPSRRGFSVLPKKATALFIIAATVCFNFNSFSVLDDGIKRNGGLSNNMAADGHHSRSLLWMPSMDDPTLSNLSTSCPLSINQSESLRLEKELRQWIVGGIEKEQPKNRSRTRNYSSKRRKRIPRAGNPRAYPLDLWGLHPSVLALEGLYEAIHRRPDTFYLVSFSTDHLLLPAMARNETTRPKISVMLPAFLANVSGISDGPLEMMQIDCEVTNTQMLSVRGNDIPQHLRQNPKFDNSSVKNDESEENNEIKETRGSATFIMNLSRREKTPFSNVSVLYNSNFTKENSSNLKMEKAGLLSKANLEESYTDKENSSAQNINRRRVDNVTYPSNINEVLQYRVNPVLEHDIGLLKKKKAVSVLRNANVERSAPGIPNFLYPTIPTPGN